MTKNPKETIKKPDYCFEQGIYKDVKLQAKTLAFNNLYTNNKMWVRYLLVALMGALSAILVLFFVKMTGLYSFGLSAILQGLARLIATCMSASNVDANTVNLIYGILFWGLYFIANIPLFIFSWKLIGRVFTKLTLVYIVVNTLVGIVLGLFISEANPIYLFGDTSIIIDQVKGSQISIDAFRKLADYHVQVVVFAIPNEDIFSAFSSENFIKAFFFFVYALIYSLMLAFIYAIAYIAGASSAGMDIISVYYAIKKQKNVGKVLLQINLISMVIGSLLGTYIPGIIANNSFASFSFLLNANIVFTIFAMLVWSALFKKLYPKEKLVKVDVITKKANEINDGLISIKYTHTTSILKVIGGYSKLEKHIVSTMCMAIEVPALMQYITSIDNEAIVSIQSILTYDGKIKMQQQRSK